MDCFLPRQGSIWRATQFYPTVTLARFSFGGSMVSGRKSVCVTAGRPVNEPSEHEHKHVRVPSFNYNRTRTRTYNRTHFFVRVCS
ncbi:hypothetical protein Hanom_Chr16g01475911 [Helianthus anomalus]